MLRERGVFEPKGTPGRSTSDRERTAPRPSRWPLLDPPIHPEPASPAGPAARDRSLLESVARGDDEALRHLYDRHGAAVFSLAHSIVGMPEEAEEVLVDVFLQAWQQAGRWDASRGSPGAWLMVITRSRALDRVRSRRRYRSAVDRGAERNGGKLALPVAPAAPHPESRLRAHRLRCLLDVLPEPQREVIVLAYFAGMTQREIADCLDIPLGTVKSRTRLALEALAREVDGGNGAGEVAHP